MPSFDNTIREFMDSVSRDEDWEDKEKKDVERDENGTYVRLAPHLLDMIPVGKALPNRNNRVALFHESVIGTIVEEWQNCPQMCCDLVPDFKYVGMFFNMDAPNVGGFSYRDRKDESKGTIIECINSGRITTLITPGLQQRHYLVFLPNAETLNAMEEFGIFSNHLFTLCFMDDEGNVQLSDIDISYEAMSELVGSNVPIRETLIQALTDDAENESEDEEVLEDNDADWSTDWDDDLEDDFEEEDSDLVGLDLTKEDLDS